MVGPMAILAAFTLSGTAFAEGHHLGYYYPDLTSEETFDRVVRSVESAGKTVRIDFVNLLTSAQLDAPESPRFVFYAKGEGAETLILTALDDDVFSTLYRALAILAQLTGSVRGDSCFQAEDLEYVVTFYDLLQLLQFDELIITDGENWTHRVDFVRE